MNYLYIVREPCFVDKCVCIVFAFVKNLLYLELHSVSVFSLCNPSVCHSLLSVLHIITPFNLFLKDGLDDLYIAISESILISSTTIWYTLAYLQYLLSSLFIFPLRSTPTVFIVMHQYTKANSLYEKIFLPVNLILKLLAFLGLS